MKNKEEKLLQDVLAMSEDMDGFKIIENDEDGIYLSVHPPMGKGKPIEYNRIIEELNVLQITDLDIELLKKAVEYKTGERVKIAPPQDGEKRDGVVRVELASNRMSAWLTIYPPLGGKRIDIEDCRIALAENGVVYGINENEIQRCLELGIYSEPILIAVGKEPIDGEDAIIDYKFRNNQEQLVPKIKEDGTVDFYNLELITSVRAGEILAIRRPATEGTAGTNILGLAVAPKKGKEMQLGKGQNVEIVNEGTMALATIDGQVVLKDKSLNVYTIYEHKGDVDFSCGNLEFVGSIIVRGSVRDGFSVVAEGDVEIHETVESGIVKAGGTIQIKKGVQGRGKGILKADGNVVAKFIENCYVESKENVYSEAIMHSRVIAGKSIVVSGKKGLLVGGKCCAGEEIKARTVGSVLGTATCLEVGVNPELRKEYNLVKEKLNQAEANLDKTCKALKLLQKLDKNCTQVGEDKQLMILKVYKTNQQFEQIVEQLKEHKLSIERVISEMQFGKIQVSGYIFPGTTVTIGRSCDQIVDEEQSIILTEEGGEIKITPFKPER